MSYKANWNTVELKLPYYHDQDYRESVVASIKNTLGDVPVDITHLEYGYGVEIFCEFPLLSNLSMEMFGDFRQTCDRGMVTSPRTIV
jgi:hypothetical protein